MTQLRLDSPQNTRIVWYRCSHCGDRHPTSIAAVWVGRKVIWPVCPQHHVGVVATIDCTADTVTQIPTAVAS